VEVPEDKREPWGKSPRINESVGIEVPKDKESLGIKVPHTARDPKTIV
jgi:hypothetical protein